MFHLEPLVMNAQPRKEASKQRLKRVLKVWWERQRKDWDVGLRLTFVFAGKFAFLKNNNIQIVAPFQSEHYPRRKGLDLKTRTLTC